MPPAKTIKMPVRTAKVDFAKHGYVGFTATARLNAPLRARDAVVSGQEDLARSALLEIYPAWKFYDEAGEPIPHSLEGLLAIPGELAGAMVEEWIGAVAEEVQRRNLVKASLTSSRNGEAEGEFQTATPVS